MKSLLAAFSVLTILPLGRYAVASEEDLVRSVLFFPLVGLVIGIILMVMTQLLLPVLSPGPLAAAILLVLIILTGGLHLDGLADLCDGLAAGGDRERILSVMKDSHVGAFAVMGLVVVLIFKYSLFYEVITQGRLNAFLIMGVLSRWAMVVAAALGRYARKAGTARPFIGRIGWRQGIGATGIAMGLAGFILKGPGLLIGVVVFLSVLLFNRFLTLRIGGLTGDALGALNEITEVLVLFLIVATTPNMEVG